MDLFTAMTLNGASACVKALRTVHAFSALGSLRHVSSDRPRSEQEETPINKSRIDEEVQLGETLPSAVLTAGPEEDNTASTQSRFQVCVCACLCVCMYVPVRARVLWQCISLLADLQSTRRGAWRGAGDGEKPLLLHLICCILKCFLDIDKLLLC